MEKQTRILIVDDNREILLLLKTLFEEQKIEVLAAQSVQQAKTLLHEHTEDIKLILSDISMPGETGFDLLSWLKSANSPFRHIPVLLMTAEMPDAESRIKGLSMGAVDYVVRPVEMDELVIRTIRAIENHQKIQSLEATLTDHSKLAIAGRIMAASNHEIKNLATIVLLATNQVKAEMGRLQEQGHTVNTNSLQALSLATNMLVDMSRSIGNFLTQVPERMAAVDLQQLIEKTLLLLRNRIKPYRLVFEPQHENPLLVMGDELRISQILINLCLNASDAIRELNPPEGGIIGIHLEKLPHQDKVALSVVDNGIGLPAKSQVQAFQAFETTKKLRGGQGLGLWLSEHLASQMGGTLSLSSEGIGKGAVAKLCLPLANS